MALTIVYDVVKADISEKTKLALLNDFDQVLALNLTTAGTVSYTQLDVYKRQIVDTAIRENAAIIGLSALMTTTMMRMQDVVELLSLIHI